MRFLKLSDFLFIFTLTLLIIYDYFPGLPLASIIPNNLLIALIFTLLMLAITFKRFRNTNNKKESLKWQIYLTIYLLSLLAFLTALGGQSASGIAFHNIFFWLVLLLSLFDMYSQWKKVTRSEA